MSSVCFKMESKYLSLFLSFIHMFWRVWAWGKFCHVLLCYSLFLFLALWYSQTKIFLSERAWHKLLPLRIASWWWRKQSKDKTTRERVCLVHAALRGRNFSQLIKSVNSAVLLLMWRCHALLFLSQTCCTCLKREVVHFKVFKGVRQHLRVEPPKGCGTVGNNGQNWSSYSWLVFSMGQAPLDSVFHYTPVMTLSGILFFKLESSLHTKLFSQAGCLLLVTSKQEAKGMTCPFKSEMYSMLNMKKTFIM